MRDTKVKSETKTSEEKLSGSGDQQWRPRGNQINGEALSGYKFRDFVGKTADLKVFYCQHPKMEAITVRLKKSLNISDAKVIWAQR